MDWKNATEEQKQNHLESERIRRARRKAARTPEQIAYISEQRKKARERRKARDLKHHQDVARNYKRDGRGYFLSWANAIKRRAAAKGIPCDVDAEWLKHNMPIHCPVLGIELTRRASRDVNAPSAPTVDRLVPELGYVRGNMHIISRRANNIKSDASAEEVLRVGQWMKSLTMEQ